MSFEASPRSSNFSSFLIGQPVSTQGRRPYRETDATPELDAFSGRIAELLAELPPIDPGRGLAPAVLDFSPEAKAHWIERYNAIESQLSSHGDFAAIPDVAAKAADNVARLAAVLYVFEHGAAGAISADTVHNAGEIVTWHLYSAKALLGPLSVSKTRPTPRPSTGGCSIVVRWRVSTASPRARCCKAARTPPADARISTARSSCWLGIIACGWCKSAIGAGWRSTRLCWMGWQRSVVMTAFSMSAESRAAEMQRLSRPLLHLLLLRQIAVAIVASVAGGDAIYDAAGR
jgi:hypothetical protein